MGVETVQCNECGKPFEMPVDEKTKRVLSVAEFEALCICDDCYKKKERDDAKAGFRVERGGRGE